MRMYNLNDGREQLRKYNIKSNNIPKICLGFLTPNEMMEKLGEKYAFSFWCKVGETHSAVRFCTSWATLEEDVDALLEMI